MDLIGLRESQMQAAANGQELADLLLPWLRSKGSTLTRQAYARDLGWRYIDDGYRLVRERGGESWTDFLAEAGVGVLGATEDHATMWIDRMKRVELSIPTILRRLAAVSSFYDHLVRTRVLASNPIQYVQRPRVDRDESSTIGPSKDQAMVLLEWSRGPRCKPRTAALVCVLLFAGLRVSEMVQANAEDLGRDRDHRTLRVTRKGGKVRRVPLPGPAWKALSVYLGDRQMGPLLLTESGERMTRQQASDIVAAATKRAGLGDGFSAHSLRHGFATLSLEAGVPLEVVQDAMGHADPRTTQRYNRARHRLDNHPGYALAKFLEAA